MPQTVPNSPTNGAIEPTVASTASPPCNRLFTAAVARSSARVIHVPASTFWDRPPSRWSAALIPESAM